MTGSNWVIKDKDGNVTNPNVIGDEDWIKANFDYYEAWVDPVVPNIPTKEVLERAWRNDELLATDTFKLLDDHPKKDTLNSYRVKLRNWPSTADFPDTRPTWD